MMAASPAARRADVPAAPAALPFAPAWSYAVPGEAPLVASATTSLIVAGFADHIAMFSLATGELDGTLPLPARQLACTDTLCALAGDGMLRVVEMASRRVLWQRPLAVDTRVPPVLRGGWLLAAGPDGDIIALAERTGAEVWRTAPGHPLTGPPSIDGNFVAIATEAPAVELRALDTGRPVWIARLDRRPGVPRLGGGRVLVGVEGGRLLVLNDRTGAAEFETRTVANVTGAPTLDADHIYAVGQDGVLRAFDRRNGAQRWYENLATRAFSGPAIDAGAVIVPLRDGSVDVRLTTGVLAAKLAPPATTPTAVVITPPVLGGSASALTVVRFSRDEADPTTWTLSAARGGARLAPSPLPAVLPGLPVTLGSPR
jgi:outer membrane protein assembly factor BamB